MTRRSKATVLVLGGGPAGLLAAAAVAPFVDHVTVVDRERRGGAPSRRAVPQVDQLHNLLHPAHAVAEELVPGFTESLLAAGAVSAVVSSGTEVYELGRLMPERDLGLRLMSVRRSVVDQVLSRSVGALDNVEVVTDRAVRGLVVEETTVSGASTDGGGSIEADLVVDAMGASSATAGWLEELGVTVPTETRRIGQWYATCEATLAPGSEPRHLMVFPSPPSSRGGLLSPLGGRTVHVSVSGTDSGSMPRTSEEVLRYVETLEWPSIADALVDAELSEPTLFRRMQATWRRYDQLDGALGGLIALGDAAASLNPLQGQGLSVAALQARALRAWFEGGHGADATGPVHLAGLRRALAEPVRRAWDLAAIAGPPTPDSIPWDLLVALGRSFDDRPDLHRRYLHVWHLLEPVDVLRSPDVIGRLPRGDLA